MWNMSNLFARSPFPGNGDDDPGGGGFPSSHGQQHLGGHRWERYFKCYPPSFVDRSDLDKGNKILLPPTSLQTLSRMNVTWPMVFELANTAANRRTHGGVLEFIAEEGTCYIPYWMMINLGLNEGDTVRVANVTLPKGTYVKLQPVTSKFLEISNPKAVLENALRHFATLTVGDIICIPYNEQIFEIEIISLKPADAVSVIETDIDVDFDPPQDYVEPEKPAKEVAEEISDVVEEEDSEDERCNGRARFNLFGGSGVTLDGSAPSVMEGSAEGNGKSTVDPWTEAIAGGVRTYCKRYEDLLAKGIVKKYVSSHRRVHSGAKTSSGRLFEGEAHRLDR